MKIISSISNKELFEEYLRDMTLAVLPISAHQGKLIGKEKEVAANLSKQRKAEFTAGRNIARILLDELNLPPVEIGRNHIGAPIWPDGICGSISHKRGYCAVVLGQKGKTDGIGIDLEIQEDLSKDVWKTFTTEQELEDIRCPALILGKKANLVFSAKEAAYKCFSAIGTEVPLSDIRVRATQFSVGISIACDGLGLIGQGIVLNMGEYLVSCVENV